MTLISAQPIQIVDVIQNYVAAYGFTQTFVITDRNPDFRYMRKGQLLIAEHDGFFHCYREESLKNQKAFAGRQFDIPMDDGSTIHATGNFWESVHPRREELTQVGQATLDDLARCYVFTSASILTSKLDDWLGKNEPATAYRKYDRRHNPIGAVS